MTQILAPSLFPRDDTLAGAEFSEDRVYRYVLWRIWNRQLPLVAFVGLNPSTADETVDDQTIRRCIGFAKREKFGGMYMLNLFAFRATDPRDMMAAADPVGPGNDEALSYRQHHCQLTVAVWGNGGSYRGRAKYVLENVLLRGTVKCLGKNKDGSPKHPLYLANGTELEDMRS